ncbi:type II toxin-antitoxin system RelE/ParE family toxin [Polaribacter vadi]|uniref:type II toxin-antitoxin system RelE/ParE family toxin n=1 Tax=Polaribacter vadi TaxID=1774273 RepID=UPI0030EBC739|tara:strand:- start:18880 stop:19158 length:279 start_codon:yes stop_codon:yes gene_type:complete
MNYVLKFRKNANEDFDIGIKYYDEISSELADRFHKDFKKTIDIIESNPLLYQIRYRNIRIATFNNFPYSVHFIVKNELIFVLTILHQKRYFK